MTMSEFISALAGGLIALIGVWLQFRKEDRDKRIDYENDIKSMIDLIVYKVARIRNTKLDEDTAFLNKKFTTEIYYNIEQDFKSLDEQVQDLITNMSHHTNESNELIQDMLKRFEPLEIQFNKFKVAFKIYDEIYEGKKDKRTSIVGSKINLDKEVYEFTQKMRNFARKNYNHKIFEPKLKSHEKIKSKNNYAMNDK